MAKQIANVDILIDTWDSWISRTNDIIDVINTEAITANSTAGITGSIANPRNAVLYGSFTTNTVATNTLTAGALTANSTNIVLGTGARLIANNSAGTAGQVLTSDGNKAYWSTSVGTGTVTQVANGDAIYFTNLAGSAFIGSPLTTTGTINIKAGYGIVVDASGISVNTQIISGGGTSTDSLTLLGKTWGAPGEIGNITPATGRFTTATATSYRIEGDTAFLLSGSVFRTNGYVDATTPNAGTTGGIRLRANPTTNVAYIQVVDPNATAEWGNFNAVSTGVLTWSGTLQSANSLIGSTPNIGTTGGVVVKANPTSNFGYLQFVNPTNTAEWGHLRSHSNGMLSYSNSLFTAGDITTAGNTVIRANATSNLGHLRFTNSTGVTEWGNFRAQSTGLLTWSSTIQAGDFAVASDERLKNVIGKVDNAVNIVKQLDGIRYTWNDEAEEAFGYPKDKVEIGVLAQQIESVLPELIQDNSGDYKLVMYNRLVAVLIEAVKELSERVETLESKNK